MGNILVTRSSMPPFEEYIDEIKDIWDTHWLTNMGAKHKELQKELLEYLGVDEIDLFTNGHMALELSLQAMNLPKNSEVITTPFTFASTTHAIVRNGSVYFAAIGGAGALLSQRIKKSEVVAYDDLGTEAIRKLEVEDFPVVVVIDSQGNNLYETAIKEYQK